MLIYSMSVSVDGFITDREGAFGWRVPNEEQFRFQPVVVGGSTPFLPPVTQDLRLDLVETRTFGSRVIYERYGRARDESD